MVQLETSLTYIGLLSKVKFLLKCLPKPIHAYNVDGTPNVKGTIGWKANTNILFPNFRESADLMVLSLGHQQVILGMLWLRKWNPKIDWILNSISIPKSPSSPSFEYIPQQYLLWWLGLDMDWKISNRLHKQEAWLKGESINKTTISTQIVQAVQAAEPVILKWCKDFADVFSQKTHDQLPPYCPYNHTIELCPDFVPKIAKVYSLNLAEMEICKDFIKEHLRTGQIVPSKSPQASLFFFMPKKDGSLWSCQDYHYLNSHTIWNAYPLPLIPELINNMKKSILFTKFDIHWEYNNIHIWEKDQWKAAFITPMELFKPTIMFFGFCHAPPTFQAFMNHIFTGMLKEKWLKICMDNLGIHTKNDVTLHHECTQWVLQCLQEHGLSIKLSKCVFDAPHMEFLDMIIGQEEIKMNKKKLEAIKEWKPPTSVKGSSHSQDLQTFTGNSSQTSPTLLPSLTCSLTRENLGSEHNFNRRPLNNSSTSSPLPQSFKSQM